MKEKIKKLKKILYGLVYEGLQLALSEPNHFRSHSSEGSKDEYSSLLPVENKTHSPKSKVNSVPVGVTEICGSRKRDKKRRLRYVKETRQW